MSERPRKPHEVAIFAAIGLGVGFTPALAIVHELAHALVAILASEMHSIDIHWASIGSAGDPNQLLFAAGYAAMVAFDFTMARVAIRRWSFGAAVFWLGHGAAQILFAAISHDYDQLAEAFGGAASTLWWLAFAAFFLPPALGLTSSLMRLWKRARHRYEMDRAWRFLRRISRKYPDRRREPDTLRQPA